MVGVTEGNFIILMPRAWINLRNLYYLLRHLPCWRESICMVFLCGQWKIERQKDTQWTPWEPNMISLKQMAISKVSSCIVPPQSSGPHSRSQPYTSIPSDCSLSARRIACVPLCDGFSREQVESKSSNVQHWQSIFKWPSLNAFVKGSLAIESSLSLSSAWVRPVFLLMISRNFSVFWRKTSASSCTSMSG